MIEARELRSRMRQSASRWLNRLLSSVFLAWSENVREHVDKRAQLQRMVVGRWGNQLLGLTFASWVEFVVHNSRVKRMSQKALVRMSHGLLNIVFWQWSDFATESRSNREQLLVRHLHLHALQPGPGGQALVRVSFSE